MYIDCSKSKLKLNQPRCFGAVAAPAAAANTSDDLLPYFTRLWDLYVSMKW